MTARLTPDELARLLGDGWEPGGGTPPPVEASNVEAPSVAAVWAALDAVPDPEVPAISVVELGIVREVAVGEGGAVAVTITPTYSGCPAMREIERDVRAAVRARGWGDPEVRTVYAPAWTTEWMSDAAREKLRAYGIAPPRAGGARAGGALVSLRRAPRRAPGMPNVPATDAVPCPRCGSADTRLESAFGATACKAMHSCRACGEPFEEFKPI